MAFEDVAGRVGRPRRTWRTSPAADAYFPDSHAELAVGVIEAARAAFGAAGLDRIVAERTLAQTERTRSRLPPPSAPLEDRVAALAKVRAEEGYLAVSTKDEDGTLLLVENHCPICAAAKACTGLCSAEQTLFERVLGPGVRVERIEHLLSGGRRCAYRIVPVKHRRVSASSKRG